MPRDTNNNDDDAADAQDTVADGGTVTGGNNTENGDEALETGDGDLLAQLNGYSDEEIENAVDVTGIEIDTHVDKRFTSVPETTDETGEDRDMPHDRDELKWLAGAIDSGAKVTVCVRVLDIREYDDGHADVIVADGTAATAIEVPAQMRPSTDEQPDPVDQYSPGDTVLIERLDAVEVRGNDYYVTLRHGFDATVEVWDEWDRPDHVPVGVTVDEKSALVNDAERYAFEKTHVARERVVETIVDEFELLNPKDTDEMWMWVDETAWEPGAEDVVKGVLQDVLPSQANTRGERNEIADQVKLATQTNDNPFTLGPPDDPDLKWCVPVQNGLIDLRKEPGQELIDHAPEHYTTRPELLDVSYDPDAECPGIMENLEKIATDEAMRKTIEEMIANVIMRNNDFRKTYIKEGDEQTGKSFIDKLVKWLVGEDGVQHMDFTKFVTDDFEADAARNSYAVIDDDASANKISKEQCSAFKKFVGSGGVRTGAKNVQRESYDPFATIMINVNDPPVWTGWDGSIKSRLMPLFFTNQFVADPDPDDPNQHQKRKESELERELRTDEELSGLLNVVIEAANRLYETEEWSIYENYYDEMLTRDQEEAHAKLIRKYRNHADTTRRFARKFMTQTDEAVEVRKDDWHAIYRRYCDDEGKEPQDPSKFWQQLRDDDTVYIETKNPYQSKRVTVHLAPTTKALEYAPAPVKDRIKGLVETPGFNTGIDETTPIAELPHGSDYVTVEGEVVTKTLDKDPRDGSMRQVIVLEDDSGGRVSVLSPNATDELADDELMDAFDAVLQGDTVRVHAGITLRDGPYMRLQAGSSSVDIVDRPAGRGSDPTDVTDADDGDGDERSQADRVQGVKDVVADLEAEHDQGAPVEDVIDELQERAGMDADQAEHQIEKLRQKGAVYEPADGRLRMTGGES
ncbi:DUF5906 domain-containing protein [Halostella salina]|uniref:DUF5906 domain-containing protein n=1 Tax=Halostella salina TaxID=1547897 RepID=UPI000EF77621|nr:DNA primase family protein [Halostella salina]